MTTSWNQVGTGYVPMNQAMATPQNYVQQAPQVMAANPQQVMVVPAAPKPPPSFANFATVQHYNMAAPMVQTVPTNMRTVVADSPKPVYDASSTSAQKTQIRMISHQPRKGILMNPNRF